MPRKRLPALALWTLLAAEQKGLLSQEKESIFSDGQKTYRYICSDSIPDSLIRLKRNSKHRVPEAVSPINLSKRGAAEQNLIAINQAKIMLSYRARPAEDFMDDSEGWLTRLIFSAFTLGMLSLMFVDRKLYAVLFPTLMVIGGALIKFFIDPCCRRIRIEHGFFSRNLDRLPPLLEDEKRQLIPILQDSTIKADSPLTISKLIDQEKILKSNIQLQNMFYKSVGELESTRSMPNLPMGVIHLIADYCSYPLPKL